MSSPREGGWIDFLTTDVFVLGGKEGPQEMCVYRMGGRLINWSRWLFGVC